MNLTKVYTIEVKSDVTREIDLIPPANRGAAPQIGCVFDATDIGDGKGFLPMTPGFRTSLVACVVSTPGKHICP